MSVRINRKYLSQFINPREPEYIRPYVEVAHNILHNKKGPGNDFLGWVDLPLNYDKEEYVRIKEAAAKICKNSEVLLVIGIGGSYLGARAAIEFIQSPLYNNLKKDTPDIYFIGNNISSTYLSEIMSIVEGRDFSINVISKSGTTTEPAIAFRIFKNLIEKKYGEEEAKNHIFVTTDKAKGTLKGLATEKGYETFVVPDDVGGRFSVLTAVGLLPIAVATPAWIHSPSIMIAMLMPSTARCFKERARASRCSSPMSPPAFISPSGGSSFTARAKEKIIRVSSLHLPPSLPTFILWVSLCRMVHAICLRPF